MISAANINMVEDPYITRKLVESARIAKKSEPNPIPVSKNDRYVLVASPVLSTDVDLTAIACKIGLMDPKPSPRIGAADKNIIREIVGFEEKNSIKFNKNS